ncbi:MAG: alpha-ketoglutarate permease [Caulobacteraceae bacterium]|nr:alpha-ketoglutarate permease [Caulobacteraceae bacterium]
MAETGAFADVDTMQTGVGPQLTPFQRIKAILGGSAGNLVEWYDWFAYTSFSIYFASAFFPEGDNTAQLWKAAVLNVVSFGARPIGAWAMGHFADKLGRRTALVVSVLMMCVGALIIACTPTYAQIGLWAPAILVFARVVQGLSVGGQYGAAATYMSEMANRKRRGFWSSFQYVTLIGGQLLALLVMIILQATMDQADLKEWGWRIPFFIGAALALVVFFIQYSLHESHSFKNAKAAGHTQNTALQNMGDLFTKYWKQTFIIMGLTAAGTSGFYAYTTYMLKFLQNSATFSKEQASNINFVMLVAFMLFQPFAGWLSDILGRKTMLIGGFLLSVLAAVPIFSAIHGTTNIVVVTGLCIVPLIFLSGYTSISAVVKAELFPAHVRALGVAFPYAVSNAIFGALVEPLALGWKKSGTESYFYWYLAAVMLLGLLGALLLRETSREHSMILED